MPPATPHGLLPAKYAHFFDLLAGDPAGSAAETADSMADPVGGPGDSDASSPLDSAGVLDRSHLAHRGRACAAALGHRPGSDQEAAVQGYFTGLWDGGLAAMVPAPGEHLTKEQFVRACESGLGDNPRAPFLDKVRELAFALADPDENGLLDERDWVAFLTAAFGVSDADARTGFALLDSDGVGQLGRMHVVFALDDYFRSPEPRPAGNRIFGSVAVLTAHGDRG